MTIDQLVLRLQELQQDGYGKAEVGTSRDIGIVRWGYRENLEVRRVKSNGQGAYQTTDDNDNSGFDMLILR